MYELKLEDISKGAKSTTTDASWRGAGFDEGAQVVSFSNIEVKSSDRISILISKIPQVANSYALISGLQIIQRQGL